MVWYKRNKPLQGGNTTSASCELTVCTIDCFPVTVVVHAPFMMFFESVNVLSCLYGLSRSIITWCCKITHEA